MEYPVPFRTVVKISFVAVGALCVLFYVAFQARYLIMGPQIFITERPDELNNERLVFISGKAFNISHLWLNDRPIYTDAQGNFKEALVLENGYTVSTLRAKDRYGRETTLAQPFVYVPASFQ